MTQEILQALRNIEDKIMAAPRPCTCHPDDNPPKPCAQRYALSECRAAVTPSSFNWTPEMCAIWPKDMRPTMSGLLAIWAALRDASVYDTSVPGPTEPTADAEGWIKWDGKTTPNLPDDTKVETKHRSGEVYTGNAAWSVKAWSVGDARGYWVHDGSFSDIIAYRVVSQ